MAAGDYNGIIRDGLWNNNPALVQILGLCPLLAVTSTVVNGFALGLATAVVITCSNVTVSLIRNIVRPEVRIPVFVMVIASFVTTIELGMNAYFHALYKILGIFIPLIVTNCNIIARAEAFASKNTVGRSLVDGVAMGAGFTAVLVVLGAMRELIGHGTLLSQADLMFGASAKGITVTVFPHYGGYLLAILPPGAFLGLGFLIALKNTIDARVKRRAAVQPAVQTETAGAAT